MVKKFDVLIKNGYIVDGTGNPWFKKDIGISRGKIKEIGIITSEAGMTIDAKGLVVSPGFIDIHNHADFSILHYPGAENFTAQGATTLVVGNCGYSFIPSRRDEFQPFLKDKYETLLPERKKKYPDMITMAEYYGVVENQGIALNLAPLIGQGAVRNVAMGFNMRDASPAEMVEMKKLVCQGMSYGAFGLSTGLQFPPGSYAETEELVELASVLTEFGGAYASHLRDQGDKIVEAVEEAIRIGKENCIPVQISHFKTGRQYRDKLNEALRIMEQARERGVEVNCDVYPYTASSNSLTAILPEWTQEGGIQKMLERLQDTNARQRMHKEMSDRFGGSSGVESLWNSIVISECAVHREYEGKPLTAVIDMQGKSSDPLEGLFDLIVEAQASIACVTFGMDEKDVKTVMSHPLASICSDGHVELPSRGGKPHPRVYGTFPRALAKYVREEKVLSLEEAVRKMTSLPASQIGIRGRGIIAEGFWADITVFDPATVRDTATFENPHQFPEGIHFVLVNGQVVVDHGRFTGSRPGKVLERTSR